MRVNVRNYVFPIIFTYRGWEVTLDDASTFFQMSDVKVKVKICADKLAYKSMLFKAWEEQLLNYQKKRSQFAIGGNKDVPNFLGQYEQMNQAIDDFFDTKRTVEYVETANCGLLDRFLGQNISGIEKLQQKAKSYIDSNLGTADYRKELVAFLQQRGFQ